MTRIQDDRRVRAVQRPWWPQAEAIPGAMVRAWIAANATTLLLAAGFATGVAVRVYYALRDRFPVNDGGLFYEMARDLQRNHFVLPEFTRYNGGEIPFVYPPLTIYLAALADTLSPLSLQAAFSVLPLAGSLLALWAVYRLADALFAKDRWSVAAATVAFALAPRSFIWLVMGGGLPRGFGLAFAILALREAYLLTTGEASRRRTLLCAAFTALTVVTHLETAAFLALSFGVVALVRPATGIRRIGAAGLLGGAVAALWLLPMMAVHGLAPFTAAMHEGGRLLDGGTISFGWAETFLHSPVHTSEAFFPIIGALGVIGALHALVRGQWLLPAWWLVTGIVGMRAFPTYITVATCLLAGYAVGQLMIPELSRRMGRVPSWKHIAAGTAVTAFCLWTSATGALSYNRGEVGAFMESLPHADRSAMAWVSEATPAEATFAVIPVQIWPGDYPSEWFPALADRVSVTTPQGYEWVPGAFAERVEVHEAVRACAYQAESCLSEVLDEVDADYVYVPAACCRDLKQSLRLSKDYTVLYDSGAMVAIHEEATAASRQ